MVCNFYVFGSWSPFLHTRTRTLSLANYKIGSIDCNLSGSYHTGTYSVLCIGNMLHRIASWLNISRMYTNCVSIYVCTGSVWQLCTISSHILTFMAHFFPRMLFQCCSFAPVQWTCHIASKINGTDAYFYMINEVQLNVEKIIWILYLKWIWLRFFFLVPWKILHNEMCK